MPTCFSLREEQHNDQNAKLIARLPALRPKSKATYWFSLKFILGEVFFSRNSFRAKQYNDYQVVVYT